MLQSFADVWALTERPTFQHHSTGHAFDKLALASSDRAPHPHTDTAAP